ncbi:MAG: helix-turn-helix transcriptional regulator [Deltaproteobacteria bacterium]|nr:helix-turn-helix transcriptional regulator [Deltaproteobacteria bacterium]
MARRIPDDRLPLLIETATNVFIEQGYRRTQMADIAQALGLAKGTLYLYVESKEALFDLVVRHADDTGRVGEGVAFPVKTPRPGVTLRYVQGELARQQRLPALAEALARRRVTNVPHELESIIRELFRALARNRRRIKLIDRSARDYPELAALWFDGTRGGFLALLEHYLQDRMRRGTLRSVPDIPAAARLMLETTVFWAVHRHWDLNPQPVSETTAENTVVHFLVTGLTKE